MPVFMMMVIALACIAGALYVAGSAAVNAVSYAAAEVRKHAGVFIVLLFGSAVAAADVTSDSSGDVVAVLLELIGSGDGQLTWVDWTIIGTIAAHILATLYINFTDTPDDNTLYGKLYRYLVEPLAGVLIKAKAKQKPFSDIRLK